MVDCYFCNKCMKRAAAFLQFSFKSNGSSIVNIKLAYHMYCKYNLFLKFIINGPVQSFLDTITLVYRSFL